MGNDLFKIQRLAGCGINLPRWSNFSILSLQTRDHLLPLSFFSLSSFFFFLSISPSSPPLLELHGARNFAGNSELSRNRCSTKTRKKYRCPRRIVGRSVSSSFFLPFLFHSHYSFSPIFVATVNGRIAESGADRIGDANKYVRAI